MPSPTDTATRPLLRPGARGSAVTDLKKLLKAWFATHPPAPSFAATPVYGPAAVAAVKELQRRSGLVADGIVGDATWAVLTAPPVSASQLPPLPGSVSFPNDLYPKPNTWNGLQPWIVPQVKAICAHFGLTVSAGWGGHPPHAVRSDHAWGGACDLVGPPDKMIACNLWADGLRADPFRKGAIFRWVGGPAHDADGVEAGHLDHVHLSWFRSGPATTVFGLPEFP